MVKKEKQLTEKQVFYLPEHGKSVEAGSLEEAIELAGVNNQEEKEDKGNGN